jgi:hypothetical protein
MGVGLTIVQSILLAYRGQLRLFRGESGDPERPGTLVRLSLPVLVPGPGEPTSEE